MSDIEEWILTISSDSQGKKKKAEAMQDISNYR